MSTSFFLSSASRSATAEDTSFAILSSTSFFLLKVASLYHSAVFLLLKYLSLACLLLAII
jgi:hypothetical protein